MNPRHIIETDAPPFTWMVRIYYEDTDVAGVVYYANYLKYMERARTEWLRQMGHDHSLMQQQHNVAFVVKSTTIEYLKPARLNDVVQVSTHLIELGRCKLVVSQNIFRQEEQLTGATVTLACVDNTLRPVAMPLELHTQLQGTK